jgi:hypothetical protein
MSDCPIHGTPEARARVLQDEWDELYGNAEARLYADWWHAWVEQDLDELARCLRELVTKGYTAHQAEDLLHASISKIAHVLAPLADDPDHASLYYAARIIAWGQSLREAARQSGLTLGVVQRIPQRLGLEVRKASGDLVADETVVAIMALRESGLSWTEIGRRMKRSKASVQGIYRRRLG